MPRHKQQALLFFKSIRLRATNSPTPLPSLLKRNRALITIAIKLTLLLNQQAYTLQR